jgi:hypothetical protein
MPSGIYKRYQRTDKEIYQAMLPHLTIGDNDCLIWTRRKNSNGYGNITANGNHYRTHRWLYEFYNSVKLRRDEHVLHSCRNRACANMEHLRVGTHAENMRDKIKDGTSGKGRRTQQGDV